MTTEGNSEAERFLQALNSDLTLLSRICSIEDDPSSVYALVRSAGFDCTPDEIRTAIAVTYDFTLSDDELTVVAGGVSAQLETVIGISSGDGLEVTAVTALSAGAAAAI